MTTVEKSSCDAVIVDFDGVVVDRAETGEELLLEGSLARIRTIYELGVIVCAVTNRERASLQKTMKKLGIQSGGLFDHVQTKTEAGVDKSEPAAHARMATILRNLHGILPEKTFYLDDNERNCRAAGKIGFNVIGIMCKTNYGGLDRKGNIPVIDSFADFKVKG